LETICSDIDDLNLLDCSSELLTLLWPEFYPKDKADLLPPVSQILGRFMCEPRFKLPFNTLMLSLSSIDYWKMFGASSSRADQLAASFASRLLCAGITECAVERVFSHVKWLIGFKRHSLSSQTIENLALLRYAN
jgi:hypothetical protein